LIDLRCGDCLEVMPTIPSGSVDLVLADPPYPEIDRDYGRLTEAEWWALIVEGVIPEVRRVLKPSGSAVFILQPNSREVGSMRPWLWDFMAWACRSWNMIQDAWWWNICAIPEAHAIQGRLLRPSLKACVWLGPPDCYRDQDEVLWEESQGNTAQRLSGRCTNAVHPSGHHRNMRTISASATRRGGVTPFNVLPIGNANALGSSGHPAATPDQLADFWVRYASPPGGVVLDPFMGSGTIPLAAVRRHRSTIGIEKMSDYFAIAKARLDGPPTPLFDTSKDSTPCDPRPALLFS
jgi:DNA modification methylase